MPVAKKQPQMEPVTKKQRTEQQLASRFACHGGAHLTQDAKTALEEVCTRLAQPGKGITAADESAGTIGKRVSSRDTTLRVVFDLTLTHSNLPHPVIYPPCSSAAHVATPSLCFAHSRILHRCHYSSPLWGWKIQKRIVVSIVRCCSRRLGPATSCVGPSWTQRH